MDGSEFDLANQDVFSAAQDGGVDNNQSSCSMDSFFDEILKDTHACTHTHTCNPPGPDLSHTHTCFHVHTKILSAPPTADDTTAESSGGKTSAETAPSGAKKRPCGNREAVRKYREKKKAQAASLEDQNRQLREENMQLQRRVQAMAALENENMRLKCLLVDLRGRIDGELGAFPYQKQARPGTELAAAAGVNQLNVPSGGAQVLSSCDLPCADQAYCTRPLAQGKSGAEDGGLGGDRFGICDFRTAPCFGDVGNGTKGFLGCVRAESTPSACISTVSERKGTSSTGC